MKELWSAIKGYKKLYEVSNLGRVKSLPKIKHTPYGGVFISNEKIMKTSTTNRGYIIVTLSKNKKTRKNISTQTCR